MIRPLMNPHWSGYSLPEEEKLEMSGRIVERIGEEESWPIQWQSPYLSKEELGNSPAQPKVQALDGVDYLFYAQKSNAIGIVNLQENRLVKCGSAGHSPILAIMVGAIQSSNPTSYIALLSASSLAVLDLRKMLQKGPTTFLLKAKEENPTTHYAKGNHLAVGYGSEESSHIAIWDVRDFSSPPVKIPTPSPPKQIYFSETTGLCAVALKTEIRVFSFLDILSGALTNPYISDEDGVSLSPKRMKVVGDNIIIALEAPFERSEVGRIIVGKVFNWREKKVTQILSDNSHRPGDPTITSIDRIDDHTLLRASQHLFKFSITSSPKSLYYIENPNSDECNKISKIRNFNTTMIAVTNHRCLIIDSSRFSYRFSRYGNRMSKEEAAGAPIEQIKFIGNLCIATRCHEEVKQIHVYNLDAQKDILEDVS